MGDLQGKPISKFPDTSTMEKTEEFYGRAVEWWNLSIIHYLASQPARDRPYDILVVSHGGLIGILLRTLINSKKLRRAEGVSIGKCFNVSVTIIEMDDDEKGTVIKYGDISHLIRKVVETNADEVV